MAGWLVTQGDNQFQVSGLADLIDLAKAGQLKMGDMIQPPGATEWLYACEVDDLTPHLPDDESDEEEFDSVNKRRAMGAAIGVAMMGILGVLALGGLGGMIILAQQLQPNTAAMIGEGGLNYGEMLVTASGSGLRAKPDGGAAVVQSVSKDEVIDLVAKRGSWYQAKNKSGTEGWISVDDVIPVYTLGGSEARDQYDPLYNPDRYVEVSNARWMQLPPEDPKSDEENNVTVFEIELVNSSRYDMDSIIILATVKDARGQELEKVEIPIEGVVPKESRTMMGTIDPTKADPPGKRRRKDEEVPPIRKITTYSFNKLAKDDPDLQLMFSSGVEAEMTQVDFTNAEIDLLQLRAVPPDEEEKDEKKK